MPKTTLPDPSVLLPLPPAVFHILMALAGEDRHGYAIIQDVAARTNKRLKLGAGTLYRSLQRMLEQGLIIETAERPDPEMTMNDAAITALRHMGRRSRGLRRSVWPSW